MSIEMCNECGEFTDTDYNVEGEYIENKSGKIDYWCESCIVEEMENKPFVWGDSIKAYTKAVRNALKSKY